MFLFFAEYKTFLIKYIGLGLGRLVYKFLVKHRLLICKCEHNLRVVCEDIEIVWGTPARCREHSFKSLCWNLPVSVASNGLKLYILHQTFVCLFCPWDFLFTLEHSSRNIAVISKYETELFASPLCASDVTFFLTIFLYASVRNKKITFLLFTWNSVSNLGCISASAQSLTEVSWKSYVCIPDLFHCKNCSCVSESYVYCISKIEKRLEYLLITNCWSH